MRCIKCGKDTLDNTWYCSVCKPNRQPFISGRGSGGLNKLFFLISLAVGISVFFFAVAAVVAVTVSAPNEASMAIIILLSFTLLCSSSLYLVVVMMMFIHKMWALIQDGYTRTTPDKAVGFLFVPIYNLYWVFQAVWGFSQEYNRYISRHSISTVRLPEGLFLAYSIINTLALIPVIGWLPVVFINPILFIVMVFKTCETVKIASGGMAPADKPAPSISQHPPVWKRVPVVMAELFTRRIKGKPLKLYTIIGTSVVVLAVVATILIPKARFVINFLMIPEQVVAGEDFIVSFKVENTGNADGKRTLVLMIDETEYLTKEVIVGAGSSETVQFEVEGVFPPGSYRISLEDLVVVLRILRPAEFTLSRFSLKPNPVKIGEEAQVAVDVSNLGEVEGSYTLSLTIDGTVEQTDNITLAGETSKRVLFTIVKNEPGNYWVALNDNSELLEVWQIVRPNNGNVFVNNLRGGYGYLNIYNNKEQDAVIVLTAPSNMQEALLSVYVRSKSSYTVTGIKNGIYLIYLATGEDWESFSRRFTKYAYYEKFEEEAKYTAVYPLYNIISIELGTTGGTARTDRVPEEKFPR